MVQASSAVLGICCSVLGCERLFLNWRTIIKVIACVALSLGVFAFGAFSSLSQAQGAQGTSVRLGIFNSQKAAQRFFEAFPFEIMSDIDVDQLWLSTYQSNSGFTEHHMEISFLARSVADEICEYAESVEKQCIKFSKSKMFTPKVEHADLLDTPISIKKQDKKVYEAVAVKPSSSSGILSALEGGSLFDKGRGGNLRASDLALVPINVQRRKGVTPLPIPKNAALPRAQAGEPVLQALHSYGRDFSLNKHDDDDLSVRAVKASYDVARNRFIQSLRAVGEGVNSGSASDALRRETVALGRAAFEAAGQAYLSGFLNEHTNTQLALSPDASAGQHFIHHVQNNLKSSVKTTLTDAIRQSVTAVTSGQSLDGDVFKESLDGLLLSGARGLIDSGLAGARKSDLYALRHIELEYNLNNFEDSYFSVLLTQPIYQSPDLRHNVFVQGGGIINEKSVDIDDDTSRHTVNIGAGYRYLSKDEDYLIGGNVFFDHQFPYNHSRMSVGLDAKAQDVNMAANYYIPLSDFKTSRTDAQGQVFEERPLEGYDIELGYTPSFMPRLNVFGKGYHYFRTEDQKEDLRGLELSAEYDVTDALTIKGSVIEENGGRDGAEIALQYKVPLYGVEDPNLAALDAPEVSLRQHVFDKVRRENRIRVEERVKVDAGASILSAQFDAASLGLPFNVGGTATGAAIDIPFNTPITVPNGDFAVIDFSNGAIANVSASGVGDVVLEFNATTLAVTATNGGFVQFITGSGGITTVVVPGGAVNLLGTDIDVSDNGTTTTIQVRAGQVEVVPDVGVDVESGNQADVISLGIASGITSVLVNPALEARQEDAFTNLDFINPAPSNISTAAPFINILPELITGPQFTGNNADVRVTFSQDVSVVGLPELTGFVDANPRTFMYNAAASSSNQLVFRHTFVTGDVGSSAIILQSLNLNGGAITSASNGLNAITAFTDTVRSINDTTAPMLISSNPVDDELGFNSGSNLVLTFNEPVQANVGNILLTDTTDGTDSRFIPITSAQVSITGSTVTINPTGVLDLSTDYNLVIGNNILQDSAGNAFAGVASGQLNFTTSNDVTPPIISSTTPADNATSIAINNNIIINFNEAVQGITGNIILTDLTDGSDGRSIPIGDPQISIVGSTVTINPASDLEIGTEYEVTFAASVLEDLIGNDFGGLSSGQLNFSTSPITSLAQVVGLQSGNYIVNADSQTFTAYIDVALGSSWILVGRGREGWQFDADGQGAVANVIEDLGTTSAFPPTAYENEIINDLIDNASIDLTDVEIRIKRAANITGTSFQDVLWRSTAQTSWTWELDNPSPGFLVELDVQASSIGAAFLDLTSATRDGSPFGSGNDHRRIFTWPWGGHGSMQGFAYGSTISGVNNNDPNTFLWESATENHAIPYAEVYIRME